jgi:DNA-binding response OmpR family regulator
MNTKPLSILLIEDSPTDAELLREHLESVTEFSFEMEHVRSLAEGLIESSKRIYDAIILDLGLPDSIGIETFERLKQHNKTIPVLILSGNDDRALLAEAMNKGADNYLIKNSADGNRVAIAILSAIRNRLEKLTAPGNS